MRAEFINPFVASIGNTFRTMLNCEIERGQLFLNTESSRQHEVSGIIGLSGKQAGMAVLSLSREVALHAASVMLLTDCTELNADVTDAVGELTNMVAGGAKAQLEEMRLQLGLPNVVVGRDYTVRFPSNTTPIVVPFRCQWGQFALEVGFAEVAVPAAV